MTARSRTGPRHTRPNSAVYIGSDPALQLASTPPGIPDLPEPPSPVSSAGSGLPSPPATNSTGGSVGDPASIAIRGDKSAASMLNASNLKAFHAAFVNNRTDDDDDYDDHDDDHGNENDQDDTARLSRRLSTRSATPSTENAHALQRALTLKERTRMTIDKLSSYSRNTPSPSSHTRTSDSASSTSRHRILDQHHSGSETERELVDDIPRPSTPRLNRTRLVSAPASPAKALLGIKQSNSTSSTSSGSPSRSRKRVSMAMSDFAELAASGRRTLSPDAYETPLTSRRLPDVAQAALAAVASSRGRVSPSSSTRKRQPLPREFFDAPASSSASGSGSRRGSLAGSNAGDDVDYGRPSSGLATPHHTMSRPSSSARHLQLSPRQQKNLNSTLTHSSLKYPNSDPRPNLERSSTLRRHQTGGRWASEDMSSVTSSHRTEDDYDELPIGRKQNVRPGGSADSALTVGAGRSLVGEGLKAAGLRNGGTLGRRADIFDENTPLREKAARDKERTQKIERIERSISRTGSRSQSRVGWEDDEDDESHFSSTRGRINGSNTRTRAGTVLGPRASTSMAVLDREREGVGGEPEPRTAPPHLRSYKSSYHLPLSLEATRREINLDDQEPEDRAPSSLSRYTSPLGGRRVLSTGEASHHNLPDRSDHNRLLHDSLRMFESHVSRVPATSSATASDLLRNAQSIVGAAEKLNLMTRAAMAKALEAQINAEVEGSDGDLAANIWRTVGAEYRDQMRFSDELVRSVTDFLLGVGRAVKDMNGGGDSHTRSVSLDELGGRFPRNSRGSETGSNGSSRRSAESRQSWGDDVKKLSSGPKRAESSLSGRPSSVLNLEDKESPLTSRQPNGFSTGSTSTSGRALNPPHEQLKKDQPRGVTSFDSQETIHALDPSPTPASRVQSTRNNDRSGANVERARTLTPLSIPKPLAQLPSESLARRQTQTPFSSATRRRPTLSGSNTVRGPFPLTSPNMPTTALTPHTVSNTDRQDFPPIRSDSVSGNSKSPGATSRTTVTFSRSSTVSALTGLQQQQQLAEQQRQRKRTQSNSSTSGAEAEQATRVSRTMSGSETEREPLRKQGDRVRMSLDGSLALNSNVHPADRSAATSILASNPKPRERRRTVVDVWPRGGS